MKKTKLTQLLSGFSGAETKRFKNFLNSPYHNNKALFAEVYADMLKFHPNYENEKLNEENLFKKAYPEKQYSYVLFKNLISDLYELAKNFMAVEELGKNKLASKNFFMQNLFTRTNIKDLIDKELKIGEQLYADEILNTSYFDSHYLFKKSICKYISHANPYEQFNTSFNDEIESYIDMGLNNLLIYALCFETTAVTYQSIEYKETVDKLIEILVTSDRLNNPVNKTFYTVLQLMKTGDERYYSEIMEMLKDEDKFLNADSKLWVYQPLEAFLIKKVKSGDKKFYRYQFELYKRCFENGIYNNEQFFAEGKLLMAVETAIRVGEFDWMENTINKNINKVSEDIREEYYNFSIAKIIQAKGENEKALVMLNKVNLETGPLKSMTRNILLKIYYELKYYEQAKTQIDAYRHYIGRDKELSETYKESVYSFLKFYNKLIDLTINKDSGKLADLEYEAAESKNIILKQWLLEKIDELK